ncbi:hypothetical protein ACNPPY_13155, partial [Achromobacter sp. AGC78]
MFDPEKFGQAMGEAIRQAVEPLQKQIAELTEKLAERPDLSEEIAAAARAAVDSIPKPKAGRDADMAQVEDLVAKAVGALPQPKDGAPADMDALREHLSELVAKLPRPADGKSVTAEDVAPVLEMQVAKWALEFERRAQDTLQKAIDKMPVP